MGMEEFKGKHAMHDQVYGRHANLEERVAFLEKDVDIAALTARNGDIEGRLQEIEKALQQDLSSTHMQLDTLAQSVQHDLEDKQLLRGNSFAVRPSMPPPKSESQSAFSFSSRPTSQATPQDQRRPGFR